MSTVNEVCKAARALWPPPNPNGPWNIKCWFTWQNISGHANDQPPPVNSSLYPNSQCTANVGSFSTLGAITGSDSPVNTIASDAQAFNFSLFPTPYTPSGDAIIADAQSRALAHLIAKVVAQLPSGTQLGS